MHYSFFRRAVVGMTCALVLMPACDPNSNTDNNERGDPESSETNEHGGIRTIRGPALPEHPLLSDHALALPAPPNIPWGAPGLEQEDWTVEEFGNPAQVVSVRMNGAPGTTPHPKRIAVQLLGGPAPSTAMGIEGRWRLSDADDAETILVIFNATAAALQGSLAYRLSSEYLWYESPAFVLKPGWNVIRIRQGASDFKTQSSNWQHIAALWKPEDCRGISILIHNRRRTGRLFIDRIAVAERPLRPGPHAP